MAKRKKSLDPNADSPAYLAGWAARLVEAVGAEETALLIRIYRQTAGNAKLSADDRESARRRALALQRSSKQDS